MNVDYTQLLGLEKLQPDQLHSIELNAKALNLEECLLVANVESESCNEVEKKYIEQAFKTGRAKGKAEAAEALFRQMKSKGGVAAVLGYLNKFGEEFKGESGEMKSFTFTVDLTGGDVNKGNSNK